MNNRITVKKTNDGVVLPWKEINYKRPFLDKNEKIYVKATAGGRFNFFTNEIDYPLPSEMISVLRYIDVDIVEI